MLLIQVEWPFRNGWFGCDGSGMNWFNFDRICNSGYDLIHVGCLLSCYNHPRTANDICWIMKNVYSNISIPPTSTNHVLLECEHCQQHRPDDIHWIPSLANLPCPIKIDSWLRQLGHLSRIISFLFVSKWLSPSRWKTFVFDHARYNYYFIIPKVLSNKNISVFLKMPHFCQLSPWAIFPPGHWTGRDRKVSGAGRLLHDRFLCLPDIRIYRHASKVTGIDTYNRISSLLSTNNSCAVRELLYTVLMVSLPRIRLNRSNYYCESLHGSELKTGSLLWSPWLNRLIIISWRLTSDVSFLQV